MHWRIPEEGLHHQTEIVRGALYCSDRKGGTYVDRAQHGHTEAVQRVAAELLVVELKAILERDLDVLQDNSVSKGKVFLEPLTSPQVSRCVSGLPSDRTLMPGTSSVCSQSYRILCSLLGLLAAAET